jgi:calcineurin-like phosphoesterase family protein
MHSELVKNFNKQVPVDGLTYFLGDIVTHSVELAKQVIEKLNGTKIIVVGNHDKKYESLYNAGFAAVMHNATIFIQNERVTMSHCPLTGTFREDTTDMKGSVSGENWHGETRNKRFSVPDKGQFHLHGHIHSPNGGKSTKTLNRQFDCGLPANAYRPVHISHIESWIMKTIKEGK